MITLHDTVFKRKYISALLACACLLGAIMPAQAALKAKYRVSTDNARWGNETNAPLTSAAAGTGTIVIDTATKSQTINGFGGCFNEHGGKALKAVDTSLSNRVIRELFDTVSGCKFNLCRMPVGASDFSIQTSTLNRWYSLNETVNDTAMTTISIARDKIYLIPFIKSAMVYRPDLKLWASPWSPPKWMKVNNDVPAANFIQTPKMLNAYALYLSKGVKLFQAEGVNLKGLAVQNEPYTGNSYPCCYWSSPEVRDFIKLYLGPRFTSDQVNCEIWSPTMNNGSLSEFTPWLNDQGSAQYIKAVCFQWEGENAVAGIHAAYPNLTLYQTENKCGSHEDNWTYAEDPTFQQMKWYFDRGANGFMQWNMVLDQSGLSAWGWAQCSMVSVDTTKKTVTFNPQHYCAKHFSYYVKPGARKIKTSGTFANQVGFKNPDGSVVIVANNSGTGAVQLAVSLGSSVANVSMPAHSFNTYIFYDSTTTGIRPVKSREFEHGSSLIKIARTKNALTLVPFGRVLTATIIGVDGRVAASLSSNSGKTQSIRTDAMAPGIYFIKGMVDGKNFTASIPVHE